MRPVAGPEGPERIYLDASVWIAWVNGDHDVQVVSRVMEWAATKQVRDSIHLAHAIVARADVLFTVDQDDYPLGKTVEGVYVSKPYLLGAPDLFSSDGA